MVGDGPERPRAAERARELGIGGSVVFLGKHASVDELLRCADLFLMTSESESFGLAALEALSCGVPVVAYAVGGLPEVISDGENGYLVPSGAVNEVADAGLRVIGDPERQARLGRAARQAAVERFAIDQVLPRYEALYRSLGAGR